MSHPTGPSDAPVEDGIPGATVVLVRDGAAGIEALMVRRSQNVSFAKGAWAFPGGRVDPGDSDPDAPADEVATARRAAARECDEEVGLTVDPGDLVPFSHWTPPRRGGQRRYLTWFFLAEAPTGRVEVDGEEIAEHRWLRPADALRLRDDEEIDILPPTWVTLHGLTGHDTIAGALAAARRRTPERYQTVIAAVEDAMVAMWDGDAGYASGDATAAGARHRLVLAPDGWRFERTG